MTRRPTMIFIALLGAVCVSAASMQSALAQVVAKPARIVIGFPPGGVSDVVARQLAERLRGTYAPAVIVDNKPGAGGRIGAEFVKNAEPDGATLLVTPSPMITIYPLVYRKLSYDPLRELAAVMILGSFPVVMVAGPALPAEIQTASEAMRWAKANPNLASYGTSAAGSTLHFTGVMLGRAANVEMTHVPFKGGGPSLQAVLGGQIPFAFMTPPTMVSQHRAGKVRALATSGAQRSAVLPDVPTLREAGFPDIDVRDWVGVFVPAKTPTELVAKLNAVLREALQTPEMADAFAKQMIEPMPPRSPEETAHQVQAEHRMWAPVVKASGFVSDE